MNNSLTSQTTLQNTLAVLQQEAVPSVTPGRVAYRNWLATALFYKWYISILPSSIQNNNKYKFSSR